MKKTLSLLMTVLILLLPAACIGEIVVTSFYPVFILTLNLAEGLENVEVRNLTAPDTGCLHDYQLQTGDMKALAEANTFLINGAGMEGYLHTVTAAFPELPVIDASAGIPLIGTEEPNAHIWLSPANAVLMVRNLAEGLISVLPEQAEKISENAADYIARLEALDAELKEKLAPAAGMNIVTFHEAFPYFARDYDLNVLAVISQDPDESLSPAELARLIDLVKENGLPPLFSEPQYEDLAARTVARETGAKVYLLDPLVTGPENDIPLTFYEDGLRYDAERILEALGETAE